MTWQLYRGTSPAPSDDQIQQWLDDPPPWRRPIERAPSGRKVPPLDDAERRRAERFVLTGGDTQLEAINVALLLRRPLLVRGEPGIGKSSLAYSLAAALGLGKVLRWEIGSRTSLQDGLYDYDAVSHLRVAQGSAGEDREATLGRYITLGPLGTALLPGERPRVLLIDELDKSGYDLPNDLLHVFEEGAFPIRELARRPGDAQVFAADAPGADDTVTIRDGRVRVRHHPVVIITTNGEREFPDAFRRRCVEMELTAPDDDTMAELVAGWFRDASPEDQARAREMATGHGKPPDWVLQHVFAGLRGLDATSALGKRGE